MKLLRFVLPGLLFGLGFLGIGSGQTVTIVSGNGQVTCQLCFSSTPKATFDPLVVKVVDAAGNPLANATVTWAITAATGQAGSLSASTTTTDATGQTSVVYTAGFNVINLFNVPFQQTTISATAGASSVQFIETQALANQQAPGVPQVTASFPSGVQISGQAGAV